MKNLKIVVAGAAAVVIVAGAAVYNKLDSWFSPEQTGPGSGDELTEADIAEMNREPTGPGSGDELPLDEPTGPGSGDELPAAEPTGPGSGDELTEADIAEMNREPTGPGSGDELPADEPTGPGSGDELPADEPTGPGSGDELTEADIAEMNRKPTGPGSGDEITYESLAKGSCDTIDDASICVEYYGSYWTAANIGLACAGAGTYSAKPCPRPALGACLMSAGTANEMATWHYGYGGDPHTESITYSAQACNANPFGQWIGAGN